MKIIEVKQGKSKSIVKTEDKEYVFSTEIVYKHRISTRSIFSSAEFFELKEQSDKILAQQYLFDLLSRQLKSKKQAKEKLKQKGFYSKAIGHAIAKAEEYKLIDDKQYAQSYINTYIRTKGSKMLKFELKKAGVDDVIIEEMMEGRDEQTREAAVHSAQKFKRLKGEKCNKEKLYRHLYNKGFDYEIIKQIIDDYDKDSEIYE